jgi:hypothetical protein
VSASATNVVLVVTREGATNGVMTVGYTTFDGTAVGGVDYDDSSGTLLFAPGDPWQQLRVPILADPWLDRPKTFHLQLMDPADGGLLGAPAIVEITIADDGLGF